MDKRPLKILLIGDASNFHRSLSLGLRRLGHDVVVASSGSGWMNTSRDIDLSRRLPGKAGGLLLTMHINRLLATTLRGFDIVNISSTGFVDLRPHRVLRTFDRLKKNNRSIFMTLLQTDTFFINECLRDDSELRYNEWRVNGVPTQYALTHDNSLRQWSSDPLRNVCRHIYNNVDGVTTALYEYDVAAHRKLPIDKIGYIGIPVDTSSITPVKMRGHNGCVNFFLGRHRDRCLEKGTDILEQAAREVVATSDGKARLTIVENRPYDEYITLLRGAHVVLDQLYSYTPATNALLAMTMAIPVVSGGEPAFYDFIGETTNRPIINASPDYPTLVASLRNIVDNRTMLPAIGLRSRDFAIKHNDTITVARRALDFWSKRLDQC